jgi:hypothetical protein
MRSVNSDLTRIANIKKVSRFIRPVWAICLEVVQNKTDDEKAVFSLM